MTSARLPLHEGRPPALISALSLALDYEVLTPSHFCFQVQAQLRPRQQVLEESLEIEPPLAGRTGRLGEGNRSLRLDVPAGRLSLRYRARVALWPSVPPSGLQEWPVSRLPGRLLRYLLPSRHCESDLLARMAGLTFGHLPPGLARVRAIEAWIHRSVQYLPGTSTRFTGARHVLLERVGVCRDFAHLGIALCRALNIPARMVSGYVLFKDPPQDFHAVFEAWLGGRWVLFDATRMAPVERLVRIGTGCDAQDVAFATFFGQAHLAHKAVNVSESEVPG